MTNEIRTSIKTVYGMLWDVLALYEKTDCYKKIPKGEKEIDIWEYMSDKLLNIRKNIDTLFLGEKVLREKLNNIVDETEHFVQSYEMPGVVKRWRKINPKILFFDCSFDLMEKKPDLYRQISLGLTASKLSCYPDAAFVEERNRYFEEVKKNVDDVNIRYTDKRIFQNELLRTFTLVFENDFMEYLDVNKDC